MFPGYAAWYGNVYMEDLPKGLEVDTKRFGVTNGIIPNATLRLIYRTGGYALILEQQGVLLESLITSLVLWILAEKKPLMSKQY